MSDPLYIHDVDLQNFMQVVVEGSKTVPVLVDFWADWCQPCQILMPILSKLADEYQGQLILAKCNADANQEIAMQLGIRSLPTVKLFVDGQPVDEFMGAKSESEVRAFLTRYIEPCNGTDNAQGSLIERAMALFENGEPEAANALVNQALENDAENADAWLALAQLSLANGELDKASTALGNLPEAHKNSAEASRLKGLLKFNEVADHNVDFGALQQQVGNDTIDSPNRFQFAIHSLLKGDAQRALDQLLLLMLRDPHWHDGEAQKSLITIFEVLGSDPLVGQYRRKMFNLLH